MDPNSLQQMYNMQMVQNESQGMSNQNNPNYNPGILQQMGGDIDPHISAILGTAQQAYFNGRGTAMSVLNRLTNPGGSWTTPGADAGTQYNGAALAQQYNNMGQGGKNVMMGKDAAVLGLLGFLGKGAMGLMGGLLDNPAEAAAAGRVIPDLASAGGKQAAMDQYPDMTSQWQKAIRILRNNQTGPVPGPDDELLKNWATDAGTKAKQTLGDTVDFLREYYKSIQQAWDNSGRIR